MRPPEREEREPRGEGEAVGEDEEQPTEEDSGPTPTSVIPGPLPEVIDPVSGRGIDTGAAPSNAVWKPFSSHRIPPSPMVEDTANPHHPEGAWVDEVIVITGNHLRDLAGGAPGGDLVGAEVVDRDGRPLGRVQKVIEKGPDDLPEAYVAPTDEVYARIGSERGGNTLGVPADDVTRESSGRLKVSRSLDGLFDLNRERGGTPGNLDVRRQLGI